MDIEALIPHVLTLASSLVAAWIAAERKIAAMHESNKDRDRRLGKIEREQDEWRATSVQLQTATRDLTHFNNRLDRLESKMDRLLERVIDQNDKLSR